MCVCVVVVVVGGDGCRLWAAVAAARGGGPAPRRRRELSSTGAVGGGVVGARGKLGARGGRDEVLTVGGVRSADVLSERVVLGRAVCRPLPGTFRGYLDADRVTKSGVLVDPSA